MKQFIVDAIESAQKRVLKLFPEYKHGLRISVKPKTDFVFDNGDIEIEGDVYDPKEVPDEFAELFSEQWFSDEDQLGARSLAEVKYIVCTHVKKNMVITHKANTAIFLIVEDDCTVKVNSVNSMLRMHVLVKSGNCVVKHNSTGYCIAHKYAHVTSGSIGWMNRIYTAQYVRDYCGNLFFGGKGKINTIYAVEGNGIVDIYTESLHNAAAESDIKTRGVVRDTARALSRGTITIGEHAGGSEAYEQQDALILSEDAEVDAIPNLEIHNHDVKCSHGSTIGDIDEEQVFYLMSRGLSRELAEDEIVSGYLKA